MASDKIQQDMKLIEQVCGKPTYQGDYCMHYRCETPTPGFYCNVNACWYNDDKAWVVTWGTNDERPSRTYRFETAQEASQSVLACIGSLKVLQSV